MLGLTMDPAVMEGLAAAIMAAVAIRVLVPASISGLATTTTMGTAVAITVVVAMMIIMVAVVVVQARSQEQLNTKPEEVSNNIEPDQTKPAPVISEPTEPVTPIMSEQVKKEVLPYCDTPAGKDGSCFDRKDFDQKTGLYPCNDGTQKKDPKDCKDAKPQPISSQCPTFPVTLHKNHGCSSFLPHQPCHHSIVSASGHSDHRCSGTPPFHPCDLGFQFMHEKCIKNISLNIHTHSSGSGSNSGGSNNLSDDCYNTIKIAWLGQIYRGQNHEVDQMIDKCLGVH